MSLQEKVLELKEKEKLSYDKLAEKYDIKSTTLKEIGIGKIKNPKLDTLQKLAKALNITIDELIK